MPENCHRVSGGEEVAVARADVPLRRNARSAAQNHLPAHELAVVLAQRALQRPETGIAKVGAASPHPAVAVVLRTVLVLVLRTAVSDLDKLRGGRGREPSGIEQIPLDRLALDRSLPLELLRQPVAGPARVSVCLVKAYLAHRRRCELLQGPLPRRVKIFQPPPSLLQ